MYKVQLEGFRSFSITEPLEIRPLTFLVGENSAGKTSFLAATRFLLEGLKGQRENPFNSDPYFLGGFEQIAHYKGGRGGRARSFCLQLHIDLSSRQSGGTSEITEVIHRFEFRAGEPQPQLAVYTQIAGNCTVTLHLGESSGKLEVEIDGRMLSSDFADFYRFDSLRRLARNPVLFRFALRQTPDLWRAVVVADEKRTARNTPIGRDFKKKLSIAFGAMETSIALFRNEVFASAPVRTQPLRVYTPSELASSSEGSHVPLQLSRAKMRGGQEWKALREGLVRFGQRSGLFSDINIKHLGKSQIDPFQIQVKVNGPFMNLVDVGYGISQALPIAYQMQHGRHDAFLLQQPEVHLHPRAQAELGSLFADVVSRRVRKSYQPIIVAETHSDYLIDRVRIDMRDGKISPDDATIIFFRRDHQETRATNIFFDPQGNLVGIPEGFREFFVQEHQRLLGI